MKCVLILALASCASGFLARPVVDDAAYSLTETCDRAPLPDPVTGRYTARGPICLLADWWYYGSEPIATSQVACRIASIAPTDANVEACTHIPVGE